MVAAREAEIAAARAALAAAIAVAEEAQVEVTMQAAVAGAMVEGGDIRNGPQVASFMLDFKIALKKAEAEVLP